MKTETPCPMGTAVNVRITTSTQSFQAPAKVVYSIPGKGMGLLFTALEAEELRILDSWLEAAVETSWLESNRRRSQRIALAIKVQVVGRTRLGEQFKEPTQTVSVSPSGAMVLVSKRVEKGQQVLLRNVRTGPKWSAQPYTSRGLRMINTRSGFLSCCPTGRFGELSFRLWIGPYATRMPKKERDRVVTDGSQPTDPTDWCGKAQEWA